MIEDYKYFSTKLIKGQSLVIDTGNEDMIECVFDGINVHNQIQLNFKL
jgi:hypothetical protein